MCLFDVFPGFILTLFYNTKRKTKKPHNINPKKKDNQEDKMPSTFKLLLEKAEQERVAQVGASGAGQAKCTGWEGWLARSEVAMHEVGPPLSLFARARTNGWSDSWWGKSGRELSPPPVY